MELSLTFDLQSGCFLEDDLLAAGQFGGRHVCVLLGHHGLHVLVLVGHDQLAVVDQSLDARVSLADFFEHLHFLSHVDFAGHRVSSCLDVWLIFLEVEDITLDVCEFDVFLALSLEVDRDQPE